jgi:pSer/pThr/pTyr-binding forkhead associated (FHA) protein
MQVIEKRNYPEPSEVSTRIVKDTSGFEITETLDKNGNVITRMTANGDVDLVLTPTEIKLFALEQKYDAINKQYGDNGREARGMGMVTAADDYCMAMDALWKKHENNNVTITDEEIQDAWNKQQAFEDSLRSNTRLVTVGKGALTLMIPGGTMVSGGRALAAGAKLVVSAAKVGIGSATDATINSVNAGNDLEETVIQATEAGKVGLAVGAAAPVAQAVGVATNAIVYTHATAMGASPFVAEGIATVAGGAAMGQEGAVMNGANAAVDGKNGEEIFNAAKQGAAAGTITGVLLSPLIGKGLNRPFARAEAKAMQEDNNPAILGFGKKPIGRIRNATRIEIGATNGDVKLNSQAASGEHAVLDILPNGTMTLTDVGSTNGFTVTIDGGTKVKIPPGKFFYAQNGDKVTFGDETFIIDSSAPNYLRPYKAASDNNPGGGNFQHNAVREEVEYYGRGERTTTNPDVSKDHASTSRSMGSGNKTFTITDNGSTNGTRVYRNGSGKVEVVKSGEATELKPGDIVEMGTKGKGDLYKVTDGLTLEKVNTNPYDKANGAGGSQSAGAPSGGSQKILFKRTPEGLEITNSVEGKSIAVYRGDVSYEEFGDFQLLKKNETVLLKPDQVFEVYSGNGGASNPQIYIVKTDLSFDNIKVNPYTGRVRAEVNPVTAKKDLLARLNLDNSATDTEIKKAYYAKCKDLHPDKTMGDKVAEEKLKDLTNLWGDAGIK